MAFQMWFTSEQQSIKQIFMGDILLNFLLQLFCCNMCFYQYKECRKRTKTNPKLGVAACFSLTALYIHASDFLTGIHTFVLAAADLFYGVSYVGYDTIWRSSFICNYISVVSVQTNSVSQLLVILAHSRYDLTKNPLSSPISNTSHVTKSLFFSVFLQTSVFSPFMIFLVFSIRIQEFPLCTLLENISASFSRVFSGMVASLQLAFTVFIMCLYSAVAFELRQKDDESSMIMQSGLNKGVVLKLTLICGSNMICFQVLFCFL